MNQKNLTPAEARALNLQGGGDHYTAFVGPSRWYDSKAASQFRILTTLGLRAHHRLLDVGCGSLRAGRLLIPYLDVGNYTGIEPNDWVLNSGIEHETGHDLLLIKRPTFLRRADFDARELGIKFDYILAHSIFEHSGNDIFALALRRISEVLAPNGLFLATFYLCDEERECKVDGWHYPAGPGKRTPETIKRTLADVGLIGRALPWENVGTTWHCIAHSAADLPPPEFDVHLTGATWVARKTRETEP